MQVHGKNKMNIVEDKEEGHGIDLKNSNATSGNGCTRGVGDSVDESKCPNLLEEDNVDGIVILLNINPYRRQDLKVLTTVLLEKQTMVGFAQIYVW